MSTETGSEPRFEPRTSRIRGKCARKARKKRQKQTKIDRKRVQRYDRTVRRKVRCSGLLKSANLSFTTCKSKKAVPQHTYEGAGEKMYSSYSFTTSALDGGVYHM
jgi:hypothetical protein